MKITVSGNSQLKLPAECVYIALAVGFSGPDLEAVARNTAEQLSAVRTQLEAALAAGAGRDLKLSSVRTWTSVHHQEDGQAGTPRHVAQVRGSFTLDDLTKVGPLLGELSLTDGVEITNVEWRLTQATLDQHQPQVLAGAFAQAHQRASWIAEAAGFQAISATAVTDHGGGMVPVGAAMMRSSAKSAPSFDLDPEDVDVSVSLNVDFETN